MFEKIRKRFRARHSLTFPAMMRGLFWGTASILFCAIWVLCLKWCPTSGYLFSLDRIALACIYFWGVIAAADLLFHKVREEQRGRVIFRISLAVNLVVIFLMGQNTIQIYDYQDAFMTSFQSFGEFAEKSVIFSNWAMYPIVLKFFHAVFGANELTGITLNAVMVSASAAMLYDTARHFIPAKTAVRAALLFAGWPSFMQYLIVLSPEFLFVFLSCCSAKLAYQAYSSRVLLHKCAFAAAAAALLAFSNFFKNVVPVMLIALAIVAFLLLAENWRKVCASFRKRKGDYLRACGVIILSAFLSTNFLCRNLMESFYGAPLNDSPQSYYMTIGMASASKGFFTPEIYNRYTGMMRESGYDFAYVNDVFYEDLRTDISESGHLNYGFFRDKLMYSFGNDDYTGMVDMTVNDNSLPGLAAWRDFFAPFNQIWYLLCATFIMFAAFKSLVMNDKRLTFYCAVTIFGFILLLMLSEVQPRYKCVFYPLLSILAADGIGSAGSAFRLVKTLAEEKNMD